MRKERDCVVESGNKDSSGGKEKGLQEKATEKCARRGEGAAKEVIQG